MRGRWRLVAMGLIACGLTACGRGGEVYAMPLSKVSSRLHGMILPAELGFGQGGGSVASLEAVSDQLVTWRITDRGRTLGWVDAKLDPVDLEHTRVAVDFRAATDPGAGRADEQRALAAVGQAIFAEAVDAELDDRPFNKGRAEAAVAAYAITHRDEMQAFVGDDQFRRDFGSQPSDVMRDPAMQAAAASNPNVAVYVQEAETRRKMEAASAPNLKLGTPDRDY